MRTSRLFINAEFIKFVMAGGVAALINFSSRIILSFVFDYVTAIVIAYLLGMATAYGLCRLFVFLPTRNNNLQQIGYFSLVNIFAILQTLAVSLVLVSYLHFFTDDIALREALAHFVGVCIPIFTSYLGHKFLTFK